MADDDAKGGAKGKTPRSGTGAGKSAATRARSTKSRTPKIAAKPVQARASEAKAKPEPPGSADIQGQAVEGAGETAAGATSRRPLPLGLLGASAVIVALAALVLVWPPARDRLAGLLSSPEPAPPVTAAAAAGAAGAEFGALAQRLGRLEKSLFRLGADIAALKAAPEARPGGPGAGTAADTLEAIKPLERRLAALEARLTATAQSGISLGAVEKRIKGLAKTLAALEARIGQAGAGRDVTGTMALMALSNALRRDAPFQALAGPARAVMAGPESAPLAARLDALGRYAEKGVPTRASLAVRFAALPRGSAKPSPGREPRPAPATATATATAPAGDTLWDRVAARLGGLVKIRRVGGGAKAGAGPAPASKGAPWQAAAIAMAAGDLGAAAAALQGAGDGAVTAWRRDAEARIDADGIADAIDTLTAARLGRGRRNP